MKNEQQKKVDNIGLYLLYNYLSKANNETRFTLPVDFDMYIKN